MSVISLCSFSPSCFPRHKPRFLVSAAGDTEPTAVTSLCLVHFQCVWTCRGFFVHHKRTITRKASCCDPKICAPSLLTTIPDADTVTMDFHICGISRRACKSCCNYQAHQWENSTLHHFKVKKASSEAVCPKCRRVHRDYIAILVPQSSCCSYAVRSHDLLAICYFSTLGIYVRLLPSHSLINLGGLSMNVWQDRKREQKKKEWSTYRKSWSSCSALKHNTCTQKKN